MPRRKTVKSKSRSPAQPDPVAVARSRAFWANIASRSRRATRISKIRGTGIDTSFDFDPVNELSRRTEPPRSSEHRDWNVVAPYHGIRQLPFVGASYNEDCPICLDGFSSRSASSILPCGHRS